MIQMISFSKKGSHFNFSQSFSNFVIDFHHSKKRLFKFYFIKREVHLLTKTKLNLKLRETHTQFG